MMKHLIISITDQTLTLFDGAGHIEKTYAVSTAQKGTGQQKNSEQTPLGRHKIRAKIGHNAPPNTVFVARRPTGEYYTPALGQQYPERDWILTRIIWLSGLEIGKNRLKEVDTMSRYIYIHGVPDDADLSRPRSKGCINMKNDDVIDLFDRISVHDTIDIQA